MVSRTALSILISIILTIILVSLVNVGISLFLNEPAYDRFCNMSKSIPVEENLTLEICEANNGTWIPQNIQCLKAPCPQGYCDFYQKCNEAYQVSFKAFEQVRFYILAILGFILLLLGLFSVENLLQITGLATGGILVFEGVVMNLQDKTGVFIALLGILLVFGVLAWRVVNKNKKQKTKK